MNSKDGEEREIYRELIAYTSSSRYYERIIVEYYIPSPYTILVYIQRDFLNTKEEELQTQFLMIHVENRGGIHVPLVGRRWISFPHYCASRGSDHLEILIWTEIILFLARNWIILAV